MEAWEYSVRSVVSLIGGQTGARETDVFDRPGNPIHRQMRCDRYNRPGQILFSNHFPLTGGVEVVSWSLKSVNPSILSTTSAKHRSGPIRPAR
jgi:hypothetical protein